MTKKITLSLALLLAVNIHATDMEVKEEGISYIKQLGKALKTNLKKQLKKDPSGLQAMGFCTNEAREITRKINETLPEGASVRRTAHKLRNTNNTADEIDTKIMQGYLALAKEGKLLPTDIKVVTLEKTNRVYKPLLVGRVCMKCHGKSDTMSTNLTTAIKTAYPKDTAIDFNIGDFRGVMVAEMLKK